MIHQKINLATYIDAEGYAARRYDGKSCVAVGWGVRGEVDDIIGSVDTLIREEIQSSIDHAPIV